MAHRHWATLIIFEKRYPITIQHVSGTGAQTTETGTNYSFVVGEFWQLILIQESRSQPLMVCRG